LKIESQQVLNLKLQKTVCNNKSMSK
jgi:hypothetical protein